jgi:hypothetical protein
MAHSATTNAWRSLHISQRNFMVTALGTAFRSSMVALNCERNVLPVAGHRKIRKPNLAPIALITQQCATIDINLD